MEICIMVIGKMEKEMDGVLKINKMVKDMKFNGLMIKKKERESISGQMVMYMMECGKMTNGQMRVNKMVKKLKIIMIIRMKNIEIQINYTVNKLMS